MVSTRAITNDPADPRESSLGASPTQVIEARIQIMISKT